MNKGTYPTKNGQALDDALLELYLNVKVRSTEEIANFDDSQLEKEKEVLKETDPFLIIEYIKSSIEILMNLKAEEQETYQQMKKKNEKDNPEIDISTDTDGLDPPQDYEIMLQKLEAEVRNHIRIEQQLKLHIDSVQSKMEDAEKAKDKTDKQMKKIQTEITELKQDLKQKEKENTKLTQQIEAKKSENKKMETKIAEYEKQIKAMEKTYETDLAKHTTESTLKKIDPNRFSPLDKMKITPKDHFIKTFHEIENHKNLQTMSTSHLDKKKKSNHTSAYSDIAKVKQQLSDKSKELMKLKSDYSKFTRLHFELQKQKGKEVPEIGDDKTDSKKNPNNTGYLLELYKKKMEDKNYELMRLKHKYSQLQTDQHSQRGSSKERSQNSAQSNLSKERNSSSYAHIRSKSHIKGDEQNPDDRHNDLALTKEQVELQGTQSQSRMNIKYAGKKNSIEKEASRTGEKITSLARVNSTEYLSKKDAHPLSKGHIKSRPSSTYRERVSNSNIAGPMNTYQNHTHNAYYNGKLNKSSSTTSNPANGGYSKFSTTSQMLKMFNNTFNQSKNNKKSTLDKYRHKDRKDNLL